MSHPTNSLEARYAALIEAFRGDPDVTLPSSAPDAKRTFGSAGLKINDKVFAMLAQGRLVLKLPRQRVEALLASGDGEPYDPRHDGRIMKEWVMVAPASALDWLPLAREARAFVASASANR